MIFFWSERPLLSQTNLVTEARWSLQHVFNNVPLLIVVCLCVCVENGAELNTDGSVGDVLQHQPEPEQVNQCCSKDLKNVINKNGKRLSILEQNKNKSIYKSYDCNLFICTSFNLLVMLTTELKIVIGTMVP